MYVKVFEQILDSSIASNYELRHFFEDMLKLSDKTGVVDMTPEAIARRINLPLERVLPLLCELGKPDPKSRSQAEYGRRIVLVDSHRDWGWIVVNYEHYRRIRSQEDRRAYNRDMKRKERAGKKAKKNGKSAGHLPDGKTAYRLASTHGDAAAEALADRHEQELEEIRREQI